MSAKHGGPRPNSGRPPIHARRMVGLRVQVDEETRAALHSIALATNSSLAGVTRKVIAAGLSNLRARHPS